MRTAPALLAALVAALLAGALPAHADAQTQTALGDGPLALDAADGVEWRREEKIFVAEGNAEASQGDVRIKADRLVAAYRGQPGGGLEIYRVDAEGAVTLQNGEDSAKGVRAAFDLDAQAILLTGPGVVYSGKAGVVTATDSLEYDLKERRAVARGDATVTASQGRLTAPILEARFDEAAGLAAARAWGGVVIRTASEVISGAEAAYDVRRQVATIQGDVRIRRGDNILTGAQATVDLATGISKLSGGAGGRVKGLVFPKAVNQ